LNELCNISDVMKRKRIEIHVPERERERERERIREEAVTDLVVVFLLVIGN